MLIDFRLPRGTPRGSGDLGRRPYSHRDAQPEPKVVGLMMAERRLSLGVRGGRTASRPSGEPRRVGLFLAAAHAGLGMCPGLPGLGPHGPLSIGTRGLL